MTYEQLRSSLSDEEAPPGLDRALHALWEDGRGNWEAAHRLVEWALAEGPSSGFFEPGEGVLSW